MGPFDQDAQTENLMRVRERINALVLEFCGKRLLTAQPFFRMEELTDFVRSSAPIAPDSAGRILRLLRREGRISYRVIDRANSLYEVLPSDLKGLGT
jgi:hypothetical protein